MMKFVIIGNIDKSIYKKNNRNLNSYHRSTKYK